MSKKKLYPVLVKHKDDDPEDDHYLFHGFDGLIEEEGDDDTISVVVFTINVAPEESLSSDEIIKNIDQEIKHWQDIKRLIKAFGNQVKVETDFYPREGDLLYRIIVPLSHKLFKHEEFKEIIKSYGK